MYSIDPFCVLRMSKKKGNLPGAAPRIRGLCTVICRNPPPQMRDLLDWPERQITFTVLPPLRARGWRVWNQEVWQDVAREVTSL